MKSNLKVINNQQVYNKLPTLHVIEELEIDPHNLLFYYEGNLDRLLHCEDLSILTQIAMTCLIDDKVYGVMLDMVTENECGLGDHTRSKVMHLIDKLKEL